MEDGGAHPAERAFTVAEARQAGVEPRVLRRVALARPHHGVRALQTNRPPRDAPGIEVLRYRCTGLVPVLPQKAFFSHLTAAALWGLPLPARVDEARSDLHVTVTIGKPPRRRGVVGHTCLDSQPGASLDGLPLSSPTATWLECRALLDLDELVILGDALAGRWSERPGAHDLPVDILRAAVTTCSGRGIVRLREAATLIRAGSRSPQETRLRLVLVRAGLPEPLMNVDVFDVRRRWLGMVDLAYPDRRIVLEYEGDHHRTDRPTFRNDIARRERFADAGWRTIRVTSDDLHPDATAVLTSRVAHHLGIR